ncbi:hypothetical protein FBR05_05980 [Deltaproteobacteria bacterium PRO3]|nr:hypothetical protein [Deltaproteobacteria bacterium PRO3]
MTVPAAIFFRRPAAVDSGEPAPLEALLGNPALRRALSEGQWRELRSLVGERNDRLVVEALFAFAGRLERHGNTEAALEVYRSSVGAVRERPLRRRFENRIHALLGTGPWQDRLEDLGRRFVAQATDPAMIFAFGLAGGIAGLVRAGTAARLALRAPGFLTRGLGARLLGGGLAYAAEVPIFVGAHRAARGLLHPETASAPWAEELAGAAVFLGVLKLSGGLAGELLRGRAASPLLRGGVSAASQLGGIYGAHLLQESLGLRPRQDGAGRVVDSVDAFLQMQVGARLLHGVMPAAAPRLEAFLEASTPRELLPAPRFALHPRESETATMPPWRLAASRRSSELPPRPEAFAPEAENAARREIIGRYDRETGVRVLNAFEALAKLLDVPFGRLHEVGRPWLEWEGERLHLGLRRLRHAVEHSSDEGLNGGYLNWLLRLSTQETIRQGRADWGRRLFELLENGAPVEALETFLAEQVPAFDLFGRRGGRGLARDFPPGAAQTRAVEALPLGESAREVLLRFLRYQGQVPMEFFRHLDERLRSRDPVARLIEPTLEEFRHSPVSYLRMVRLFQVLEHDAAIDAKLFELADPRLRLWGDREREVSGYALLRSQGDGYLADLRWLDYLNRMLADNRSLRNPLEAMRRRERSEEVLRGLFPEPRELSPEDLTRAFEALGDPISTQVAAALRAGEVEIRLLPDFEFEALFARENRGHSGAMIRAFLLPAGEGRAADQLVLRQVQRVSEPVFRRVLRERLVDVVHEFDHHLRPTLSPRTDLSALREELPAHLRHIHYRALLGHPEELDAMFRESPAGPALYLRDRIEAIYFLRNAGRADRSPAMALDPAAARLRLASLEGQSEYIRGLLNLAAREFDGMNQAGARPLSANLPEWLTEADWALEQFQRDVVAARGAFGTALREDASGFAAEREAFQRLDASFTTWRRASRQLRALYDLYLSPPSMRGEEEIRRRGDWLALQGVFDIAPPRAEPVATEALDPVLRYETGLDLLRRFHPNFSPEQAALYERAARGPIRGRDIAFDLDKTLGDTLMRYLAEDAYRERPQDFDVRMEDYIHQYTRLRLPYRGVQAMLLGLWAAGNRVRLYTASENLVGNHEVFFNDFPLIKVAMEIAPPGDPHRLVGLQDLNAAPHYMDRLKFREHYARHFESEVGRDFLEGIRSEQELRRLPDLTVAKLPFPDFPFDVLVDDLYYFAGDLMTVGLGRRWVRAEGDVLRMLEGLEEYFSGSLPETSPLWRRWLGEAGD